MKINSIPRKPINTLSNFDQEFFRGDYFSLVYTTKGETLIFMDDSDPATFRKGCLEFHKLTKLCKLPFHFISHEESQITDHRGFTHSFQRIKDQVALNSTSTYKRLPY